MTVALLHLGRTAAGPQLTLELARAMISEGVVPAVVYSANAEIADRFGALEAPTLAVRTFDNAVGAVLGMARLPAIAAQIDRFLRDHDVHAVVVTMEQVWQGMIARRIARGRRVLLFVHDARPHPGEDGVFVRWLRDQERAHADGAIVLSDHVAAALRAQGAFPAAAVHRTVHPAFEVSTAVGARDLPADRPTTIGFFGRMSPYKGLGLGAETVFELRRRGRRVVFHVAGQGVPRDLPGVDHPDTVIEDRWIPQNEVVSVLERFDLMLLPYTEASQSGVLAYAMALGIPAIATPVGGLVEQAADGGGAVVAEAVTAASLADAVETLLDHPERYRALSTAGLAAARSRYSWARTARDVIAATQ